MVKDVGLPPAPVAHPGDVATVRDQIAQGGHILASFGILDAFGHVSARHPDHAERFLMTKRIAPALARPEDVLEFGPDAAPIDDSTAPLFGERFIHSAIYAARPDVNAIVHSHSREIIASGLVPGHTLRPVCHSCGFLGSGAPVFDIRDNSGDNTDMLIKTAALGKDLASALGPAAIVLMRRHGATVVGTTVPQAIFRSIYAEENAQLQRSAQAFGTPSYLTDGEAEACEALAPFWLERSWQLWISQIGKSGPPISDR